MDDATGLLRRELAREREARRQAEALLEQKSLELYNRNLDLQREIQERRRAEERLREQAQALKRSNEDLEQFAYAASHDLQAPLRSITGFSTLLVRSAGEALGAEAREFLGFIESSALHMHRLINALLEYARVGRAAYRPAWISSRRVVEQACRQLESTVKEASATVVPGELPDVYADATLLTQLFQNLIGNGIKYARHGVPPEIRVSGADVAEGWRFVVQDNGIGIPAEAAQVVFTIFKRLHTQEQYPGTGIGLSICQKIVERHGGRIWVEPALGSGTSFCFTLAAAKQGAAA